MTLTCRSQWITMPGHTINKLLTSYSTRQVHMWKKVLMLAGKHVPTTSRLWSRWLITVSKSPKFPTHVRSIFLSNLWTGCFVFITSDGELCQNKMRKVFSINLTFLLHFASQTRWAGAAQSHLKTSLNHTHPLWDCFFYSFHNSCIVINLFVVVFLM